MSPSCDLGNIFKPLLFHPNQKGIVIRNQADKLHLINLIRTVNFNLNQDQLHVHDIKAA